MTSNKTQLWVERAEAEGAKSGPRPLTRCPHCGAATEGRPFCVRDGELTGGAFVVSDRYRIESSLGVGGMALVFAGQHHVLGKPVAVKFLRPELASDEAHAQRFLREARIASQLVHENIVAVLDFGHDDASGLPYLVMDRLRGPTLAEALASSGAMHWARVVPILMQLARALGAAHSQDVAHRDLTPRNIALEESSGRSDFVKLCDFGLSRMVASEDDRVTVTGAMMGTPAYAAPEQVRGDAEQDTRVDLYALGVIAYELLTGRLPFEGNTPVALLASKLHDEPTPIRNYAPGIDLPQPLEDLIVRCLAREPAERPESATAIEAELAAIGETGGTPSRPDSEMVGRMIGNYRITGLLGSGGVGAVYRGEHPVIGMQVAVKMLLPELASSPDVIERFIQEARASSATGSPHIPRYFDFGHLDDGRAYAVMEFFDGETLEQALLRRGRLPVEEVASLLAQAADAMAHAHAAGVVHRDLKPENLFLHHDPHQGTTLKVLDFGIAKVRSSAQSARLTRVGFFMGSPLYCAPEQVHGKGVDARADIYALGVVGYEMLTGQVPFEGDIEEVFAAKSAHQAPSVKSLRPEVPDAMADLLARMLARDPATRIASMKEVAEVVRTVEGTHPTAGASVEPSRSEGPSRRTRWPAVAAVGGLLTAALVGAAVVLSGGQDAATRDDQAASPAAAAETTAASEPNDPKEEVQQEQPPAGLEPPADEEPADGIARGANPQRPQAAGPADAQEAGDGRGAGARQRRGTQKRATPKSARPRRARATERAKTGGSRTRASGSGHSTQRKPGSQPSPPASDSENESESIIIANPFE